MTEEIRRAVIKAISEKFGLPVYGQGVPQGARRPCLTVEIRELEQKRLLGRRAARKVMVESRYFCGGAKTAAEGMAAADGLFEVLSIIGTDEKFAASGMKQETTEDGVKVMAEYEYHIIFDEEEIGLMERLEYNGKEAVGYETEGDIQQGTAE